MRSSEERLMKMHERAADIKQRKYRTGTRMLGAVSAGLMACLVIMIQQVHSLHHGVMDNFSTGSSLLSDSVGGYVLIAVVVFFMGAILTVVIMRKRRQRDE